MLPTSRSVIVYSVLSTLLLGVALAVLLSSEDVPPLRPIEGPRSGAVQLQPQEPQGPDAGPVSPPDGDGSGTAAPREPGPAPQGSPPAPAPRPRIPTTPTNDQYGDTVSRILSNVGEL
jgi:hypothetical protein